MFRTLLRVVLLDKGFAYCLIPEWNVLETIKLDIEFLPDKIVKHMYCGTTEFYVWANMSALHQDKLNIKGWL